MLNSLNGRVRNRLFMNLGCPRKGHAIVLASSHNFTTHGMEVHLSHYSISFVSCLEATQSAIIHQKEHAKSEEGLQYAEVLIR